MQLLSRIALDLFLEYVNVSFLREEGTNYAIINTVLVDRFHFGGMY